MAGFRDIFGLTIRWMSTPAAVAASTVWTIDVTKARRGTAATVGRNATDASTARRTTAASKSLRQ